MAILRTDYATNPTVTTTDLDTISAQVNTNTDDIALGGGGGGTGNVVGQASSVDSEVALFSGTGGKTIKRATGSGIPKLTSGVQSIATAGTDYVAPGGALGTPTSGTLTNCTGLPLASVVNTTTGTLGVGALDVGHASDTTLGRLEAGLISVEGVGVPTITGKKRIAVVSSIPGSPDADTLYVVDDGGVAANAMTFSATPTFDLGVYEAFTMSLTGAITSATFSNGVNMKSYRFRFKDNGTARAIALGSTARAVGITIPTTTVISKTVYLVGIWNSTDTKMDFVGVAQEA